MRNAARFVEPTEPDRRRRHPIGPHRIPFRPQCVYSQGERARIWLRFVLLSWPIVCVLCSVVLCTFLWAHCHKKTKKRHQLLVLGIAIQCCLFRAGNAKSTEPNLIPGHVSIWPLKFKELAAGAGVASWHLSNGHKAPTSLLCHVCAPCCC